MAADAGPEEQAWDMETDPCNPQPLIWPVCVDCGDNFEYRSAWSITRGGTVWAWFTPAPVRGGCKHRNGVTRNVDFNYNPER